MDLVLKGLRVAGGVLQSPLANCTDLAFRLVGRRRGMGFAFLEMASAHALLQRNSKTLKMLQTLPEDRPLGAQLVGCEPDIVAEAAAVLEGMGFDLIDLNLGCPVPKVTGGGDGAGSALLRQPKKAEEMFRKVVAAVKRVPVTVKMRTGYTDASGAEAVDIARRAEGAGICAVTVHGRTREQQYSGQADYGAIGRVKAAVSIPVIGNGDVTGPAQARRLIEVSRCDAVMIGRGGMGNPWVYRNVATGLRDPSAAFRCGSQVVQGDGLQNRYSRVRIPLAPPVLLDPSPDLSGPRGPRGRRCGPRRRSRPRPDGRPPRRGRGRAAACGTAPSPPPGA